MNWLLILNLIYETLDWGKKWLADFNAGKTQLVSFDRSNNTGSIDVKMDGPVLEEKSSFKMLGLTFSSKLDWGSYIISIAKTASKKIGALIRSMKFLSLEVPLYLYKSTKHPCMEYCCHVWTVGPSLGASLEPLAHHRNVSSLSLFFLGITLLNWFHFRFLEGGLLVIFVNTFFPRTARLWNSLPIECFPLSYNLNGFKSRINRRLLTAGSFLRDLLYALIFFCFFFL